MKKNLLLLFIFIQSSLGALTLDRVILASDTNPMYLEFWPLVAQVWYKVTGLRPTLALIAGPEVIVDETVGDVIRFDPISSIPTSLQAQVIRLLLPAFFPEDGCLISDIDMIPLQRNYFTDSVRTCTEDQFVVYRDGAYAGCYDDRYPMCYIAGKGKTFADLFGLDDVAKVTEKIKEWHALGLGWNTDEMVIHLMITRWELKDSRVTYLGNGVGPRVDRLYWGYNEHLLKLGHYIDAHMLRPYVAYQKEIDQLIQDLGIVL